MSRGTIYLAGSINDKREIFCREWRNYATNSLEAKGFSVINPIADKDLKVEYLPDNIVKDDLASVESCDLVLAEMTWDDYPYVGTSIEMYYAYEHNIPVIVWSDSRGYFLRYFATECFSQLPLAITFINSNFENMKRS